MRYLVSSLVWLLPVAGFAQSTQEATEQAVRDYKLTETGLARFGQATENLQGKKAWPCKDKSGTMIADRAVAQLERGAGVKDAIKSAGMTTRDYVLFSWTISRSGIAAAVAQSDGTKMEGVTQANVDFFRQHQAEFQNIATQMGKVGCYE
jgi:hypothetical protein